MGLRITLISILSFILAVSGVTMTLLFRDQLISEAAVADRSGAAKDMKRLQLALDQKISELDIVLGSWANYTSFYEHAAKPSAAFRRDELSADALIAAHFDWINLINDRAQIVEHGEVPLPDGSTPIRNLGKGAVKGSVLPQALQAMVTAKAGCSLIGIERRLAVACFRPLLTTDAKGPPRGTVLIGRWLSDDILSKVAEQTGLIFSIVPRQHHPENAVTIPAPITGFGKGAATLVEEADRIWVEVPVRGLTGNHIADVRLNWPRESAERTNKALRFVTGAMVVLILVTAALMILVADQLLVRRLRRVRTDLGQIIAHQDWEGKVNVGRRDELTELATYINEILNLVRQKMTELRNQSFTDMLTQLPNRRRFDGTLASTLAQFHRDGKGGALALFDIDHFKRYNDSYGHPCGDSVLVKFGACLTKVAKRPIDLPARLGGEEFALLMPLTDLDGARHCAELARSSFQGLHLTHSGNDDVGVATVSAGLTMIYPGDTAESLYSRADTALYEAKHSGRNQVVVRSESSAAPPRQVEPLRH